MAGTSQLRLSFHGDTMTAWIPAGGPGGATKHNNILLWRKPFTKQQLQRRPFTTSTQSSALPSTIPNATRCNYTLISSPNLAKDLTNVSISATYNYIAALNCNKHHKTKK